MKRKIQSALLLLSVIFIHAEEAKLHQINVIFRHGDRTPETFPMRIPNDPHMYESFHPTGPGNLTNEGKLRVYRLGEILRNRYRDFLGSSGKDQRDSLFAISSDITRAKISLQLMLAGLLPPSLDSKWNERLEWQPIPTHYYKFAEDKFFNQDKCQMYLDELASVKKLPEVQEKIGKFDGYLEDLNQMVGKKSKLNLNDILILHNNLSIEKKMNMTMLPWMNNALADTRLVELRRLFYELHNYNDRLQRLQVGPMIRKINEDMLEASTNSNFSRKVIIYSGHDKNIIGLLQAFKLYDGHFPEFTSALIFELWSRDNQYHVKILYYLGIPEEIKELTLSGCRNSCPLEEYLRLTKNSEIRDDESNCKINGPSYFLEKD